MKIVFVADVFVEDGILGGGELNNHVFCEIITSKGHEVIKIHSQTTYMVILYSCLYSTGTDHPCRNHQKTTTLATIYSHVTRRTSTSSLTQKLEKSPCPPPSTTRL